MSLVNDRMSAIDSNRQLWQNQSIGRKRQLVHQIKESGSHSVPVVVSSEGAPDGSVQGAGNGFDDDQLIVLHEVVRALAREQSLNVALRLIAEKARQLTLSETTAICLIDQERVNLDFAAVAGRGAAEMAGQTVRVGDALTGQTALTGEALLAYNPLGNRSSVDRGKYPHVRAGDEGDAFILSGGVRSAAVVPIYVGGVSVGSLGAIDRTDGESFTGRDLLVLNLLASAAAAAIQQEGLRRERASTIRERDVLQEAARATSSTLNVQSILDGVLSTLSRSFDMASAFVFLLNDERTHLFIAADVGLVDEDREIQLLADGCVARAAFGGGGFIVFDPEEDARFESFLPDDRSEPQSWILAPLISRETPLGLIAIGSMARNAYTAQDLRLVMSVANLAAVAMENAELYEAATRRTEEATAIYELSQGVNTNLNLHRVLDFVADSVLALLHVDKFALFLHNPASQCLEIKVARNIRNETVHQMRPDRAAGGIAWWVFEYETPTAVVNVAADHRDRTLPISGEGVASLVSVPLQAGDEVIGVIHAMSSRLRSFTVGEMELLYTIANQVGVAVSNIQILADTRQKSEELRRASRRVARALGTHGDTAQTAQTIVDLAAEIVRGDKSVLYALDARGELVLTAARNVKLPPDRTVPRKDEAGKELCAYTVARRGRSVVIEEPAEDGRYAVTPILSSQLSRCSTYLGMPLKIGAEVVGVLEVYLRDPRSIPTDELRQYVAFSAQAAVALQNAILVEEAGRRKQDLDLLVRLAEIIAEGNREELPGEALALLSTTLGADGALVLIKPAARNRSPKDAAAGIAQEQSMRGGLLALARLVGDSDSTVWRPDSVASTANMAGSRTGDHEVAASRLMEILGEWPDVSACPLIVTPMLGGALCLVRSASAAAFDDDDVRIVETVARVLGPAAAKAIG